MLRAMMPPIETHRKTLEQLCRSHQVERLYAFGSVLTDDFTAESDIDFLLTMPNNLEPLDKGEHILQLWSALEELFERDIDLLTDTGIHNPYLLKAINDTKRLVYEADER